VASTHTVSSAAVPQKTLMTFRASLVRDDRELCVFRALRTCVQAGHFRNRANPHGVSDLPPPFLS
jgi:hypothetical protein